MLAEGGAAVITSLVSSGLADRLVVGLAPVLLGAGLGSIGNLDVLRVRDGLRLEGLEIHLAGDDLLVAGNLVETHTVSESTIS